VWLGEVTLGYFVGKHPIVLYSTTFTLKYLMQIINSTFCDAGNKGILANFKLTLKLTRKPL
jgi:hypothetical protein